MKKKKYWIMLMILGLALSGCAETPEQAVVREKSDRGVEGYQEDTGSLDINAGNSANSGTGNAADTPHNIEDSANGDTENAADTPHNIEDSAINGTENAADTPDNVEDGANSDTENAADTPDNTENSAGDVSENTAENALAQKLQAPENYQLSLTSEDGKFKLECDADVYVPDVQKVPIYQVSQKEFSQEVIDQVTEAFFGDAPVCDSDYIYGWTKAEIEEKLNEWNGYLAAGNLDPYGYLAQAKEAGADEEELERLSHYLQDSIDEWEGLYADAPDTKEKKEVHPGFANLPESDEEAYLNDSFTGYVETQDGNFLYSFQRWSSMPMEIRVERIDREKGAQRDGRLDWFQVLGLYDEEKADASLTEEEQRALLEEQTGITKEEAIALADQYVKRLGLAEEVSAKNVILSRGTWDGDMRGDDPDVYIGGYGWQVDYTRDVDGFPVTDEMDSGGALESMESTLEPWCYELIQITVNQDGLQFARIENLYDMGEQRMENVQMLSFPEIADIFAQIIQIQNADMGNTDERKITITKIALGDMRIYDPSVDSTIGTLVPVWDFFGFQEHAGTYEGESYYSKEAYSNRSFLTINAADGTIVNRSLGY